MVDCREILQLDIAASVPALHSRCYLQRYFEFEIGF